MGWLRQLKESYWQPSQVDQLDSKLEPLRLSDTSVAQQSPIERFVEMERDLGRMTLVTQALVEACVRKGLLTHDEIAGIVSEVDLSLPTDARWGAAATERPSLPLTLIGNAHATAGTAAPASSVGLIDDFENAEDWGNDDEPTEVEGGTALATTDAGFDFGGGPIDPNSAIEVGKESAAGDVASIPRTAPFPKPKKRQQSSAMRQIVGMGLSGVIGLGIGYFILLWFTGQDIIKAAHMLPRWMVPVKFHAKGDGEPIGKLPSNGVNNSTPLAPAGEIPDTSNKFGQIDGAGQRNPGGASPVLTPNVQPTLPAEEDLSTLEQPSGTGGGDEPTGFVEPPLTDDPLAPQIAPPVIAPKTQPKKTEETAAPAESEEPATAAEPTSEPADVPSTETSTDPDAPAAEEPGAPFEPKQFVVAEAVAVNGQALGEAVKTANLAMEDLKAGTLTDNDAKKTKVGAFQKFCELAKAVTFVDGEPAKEQLPTRIAGAEKVATMAVEEEAAFKDVAEIAHQWIFKLTPDRRSTSGVFLTGTVKDVQPAGELKLATVDLGGDRIVNVVTPIGTDVVITDRVAVLGVVVEDPATKLSGYEGPAETAVWSEHILKAEAPIIPME